MGDDDPYRARANEVVTRVAPMTPSSADAAQQQAAPLPKGWHYEQIGSVLVRSRSIEALSLDELIAREVQSLALGDPRPKKQLEAAVRRRFESMMKRYRCRLP